jgi:hypothetical protein
VSPCRSVLSELEYADAHPDVLPPALLALQRAGAGGGAGSATSGAGLVGAAGPVMSRADVAGGGRSFSTGSAAGYPGASMDLLSTTSGSNAVGTYHGIL